MGSRKAYWWRRVPILGLVAIALFGLPNWQSSATSPIDVMFVVAHPDDDIILGAGVIDAAVDAGQDVMVGYLTNGDEYDDTIGTTRQGEGVAAQSLLGMAESDLVFMGYPSTYLDCIRYGSGIDPTRCAEMASLNSQVTYASRGLGSTDWHTYRTGSPADFTWANFSSDLIALLNEYQPAEIYTHAYWDIHSDHKITYLAVIEAIAAIPGYNPTVHAGLVHVDDPAYPFAWPNHSPASPSLPHTTPNNGATLTITPTNEWALLESDTASELKWMQREVIPVPGSMLNSSAGSNLKYQAVAAHASQFYDTFGLIQRFIHSDEVFWTYREGAPVGIADSYSVDEGGSVGVGDSGVLINDIRGAGTPDGTPVLWSPLGELQASLVDAPDHGTLTSWNSDGNFVYVHNGSANYTDSFIYQPFQGSTYGGSTTVTITINPIDDDPTADNDGPYSVARGESVNVSAPGVLDGDSDPEGLDLTAHVETNPTHGSLTLNSNGSFTYSHDGNGAVADSFTYRAKDPGGNTSDPATVSLTITASATPLAVDVSGPTTGAQGVAQNFTAAVTGGEGTRSYVWQATHDGSVVAAAQATFFSFEPEAAGDYDVTLVVSDDSGSASDSVMLTALGDIADSTFANDIIWLADEGITQGCNPPANDQFCPNDFVTRGQMAAFLVRFLGLTDDGGGDLFDDDNGSVFETNIDKLATAGITRGCNEAGTHYCPEDRVTRGQMAAFLVRALGLTDDGGGDLFDDDDGSIFETSIDKLATAEVTKGCNPPTNDRFCPDGLVTRGQMAAFLHRAAGLLS